MAGGGAHAFDKLSGCNTLETHVGNDRGSRKALVLRVRLCKLVAVLIHSIVASPSPLANALSGILESVPPGNDRRPTEKPLLLAPSFCLYRRRRRR